MIAPVDMVKMLLSDANIFYFDIASRNGATHTIRIHKSGRYVLIFTKDNGGLDHIKVYDGSIPKKTILSIDDFAEKMYYL